MHRVARRKRSEGRKPRIGETAQRFEPRAAAHDLGDLARLQVQCVPHSPLDRRQMLKGGAIGIAKCELRRMRRKAFELGDRSQLRERGREAVRQQAERHGLARTHAQPMLPVEVNLAVAAETAGTHVDGLDHRAPRADESALAADDRPPAGDDRDVRRGTAHVRDDEILEAGEEARADHARSGAR